MKAIVYTSHAGHTAEYANMLAEKTGLPAYSLKEARTALPAGTEIIYMGWIMGSQIKRCRQAARRYTIACAIGVGMGIAGSHDDDVRTITKLPKETPLFTLQGGLEHHKLKFGYRFLMKRITPSAVKMISRQKDKTQDDFVMLAMLLKGKNAVCIENLIPVLEWYNQTTGSSIEIPAPKPVEAIEPEPESEANAETPADEDSAE